MAHRPHARRRGGVAACAAVLALAGACRTTESKRPAMPDPPVVYRAAPVRGWDVLVAGVAAGRVVHFVSADAPDRSVYVVRDVYEQDLGWIDGLGRAYRLLPHHREPAWIGTGTVAQGVQRILRTDEPCELVETALPEAPAEASAPR